jgi:hypothetical protein
MNTKSNASAYSIKSQNINHSVEEVKNLLLSLPTIIFPPPPAQDSAGGETVPNEKGQIPREIFALCLLFSRQ